MARNNIYSNNIMSNSNELVRRLLSGITMSELQNLVNIREEARPIPAPRIRREKHALFLFQEEGIQFLHQGEMSDNYYSILRLILSHHIGLFRFPEQRNNNQYQPLGQEIMKNEGL